MSPVCQRQRESCPCCARADIALQREMEGAEIMECRACGSAFSGQLPPADEVAKIYDDLYKRGGAYEQLRAGVARVQRALTKDRPLKVGWEHRRFFDKYAPASGDRLLDIGCGVGLFLVAAAQAGWSPVGVEVSKEAAELGGAVHDLPVHVGRMESTELGTESYAAVTAWEVLEHIAEPARFLRRVLRLLQPGGVFSRSVPNYARRRYRYGTHFGPASVPPVHLSFWTPSALQRTLELAGFCDVEVGAPRMSLDLLRPLRSWWRPKKVIRFAKVLVGADIISEMFFFGRRPA